MFEPDEFIFSKFAAFFKRRKQQKAANLPQAVQLKEIKGRLTILARALTGQAIDIYEAEREGGYKNNNFFLPASYHVFDRVEDNLSFYLFRVLYLSVQQGLGLNWWKDEEQDVKQSRRAAEEVAAKVLQVLLEKYAPIRPIYKKLKAHYSALATAKKEADYSFLYGKFMLNTKEKAVLNPLQHFSDQVKKIKEEQEKTTLKANAVEEVKSMQVDKKQLEDNLLLHQFEKVETAEEFGGNWKDLDGDDELEEHANALDELNMRFTVRVDDPTHSVYQAEFTENTTIAESKEQDTAAYYLCYDEWDYKKRSYKENFCKVYPQAVQETDVSYYKKTLVDYRATQDGLRKMLSTINNKYQQQRRQAQGDAFDLDAVTDLFVDIHSGHTPSEHVYLSNRKREKDLSILLLLDSSLSSDGYAAGNRVIDVEKQVSILFGEILNEFHIDFAISSFYSKTRNHASYFNIKSFDEPWSKARFKVGSIVPSGYTRIGVALRHSAALLDARPSKNKWVILLSDGKPNDYDRYEGKYGIHDVKQALREMNSKGIQAYALAIEAQAKYYLPQMFGANHYQILTTPVELLQAMSRLYERIKYGS